MIKPLNFFLGVSEDSQTYWSNSATYIRGSPQTDGQVERLNRTLKQMMSKLVSKEGVIRMNYWEKCYLLIELPHTSSGKSPFYLVYGRNAHTYSIRRRLSDTFQLIIVTRRELILLTSGFHHSIAYSFSYLETKIQVCDVTSL